MATFNDVPFNFVPLNHEVFIPDWGDRISQDIPFENGEDGIISFEITNKTPLFIKNGIGESKDDVMSAHITDAEGKRHYYIPATSLKGMVRSVLEILSFSKMQRYNDDYFGYRIFDTKQTDGKFYVEKMKAASCGWLIKDVDKEGRDKYVLIDCGEIQRIEMDKLLSCYKDVDYKYVEKDDLVKKVEHFRRHGKGTYPVIGDKCLVCTGYMFNKEHEYLFPKPSEGIRLEVDSDIISAFLSVYKPSKAYYEFINDMLKSREPLAVFFTKSGSKVETIGITRMFRYPYKHSVSDGVKQSPTEGLDLSECIFGYTNRNKSLRGRVQFGNAFAIDAINGFEEKKGVLGQPQASYYPYYLHQSGFQYNTYSSEKIEIAGRKRYRVHAQGNVSNLPQGNDNENVMTVLNLLPAGNKFKCKIKVHNLRPVEIGALLSAITFHGHSDCHHNIGMAKAMGYGRLAISDIQLLNLSHDMNFYMAEFEKQMSSFIGGMSWIKSKQVNTLLQIAADHKESLDYMDFDGYKEGKRNSNFTLLAEKCFIVPQSLLTPSDIGRLRFPEKYEEIEQCIGEGKYNEVLSLCDELEKALLPIVDGSIENFRTEAQQKREAQLVEKHKRIEKCFEEEKYDEVLSLCDELEQALKPNIPEFVGKYRKRVEKTVWLKAGLEAFLDEKNLHGEYKVKDFKLAMSKVRTWMKDTGDAFLSEEDLHGLQRSLKRIYGSLTKPKEKKDWENADSHWWKELGKLIGGENASHIHEQIIN